MLKIKLMIVVLLLLIHNVFLLRNNQFKFKLFEKCMIRKGVKMESIVERNTISNHTYYTKLNYQWNSRLPQIYPIAYFLPDTTKDVQAAVKCGVKLKIPIIPKSGGHSLESYSFGNSRTIVIDFRNMSQIIINKEDETAMIGPGALGGTINSKLWKYGGFAISMGDCHEIGIGGHALGGGQGYFSQKYGLTLDNIIEMTMVDAFGNVHKINNITNSDLFWGLRGVGSGYIGIVTDFKFKLFPAYKLKITLIILHYDIIKTAEVFEAWQNWLIWIQKNEPSAYSSLNIKGECLNGFCRLAGFSSKSSFVGDGIEVTTIRVQDKTTSQQLYNDTKFLKKYLESFPETEHFSTKSFQSYFDFIKATGFVDFNSNKTYIDLDLDNLRNDVREETLYGKVKSFYVDKIFKKYDFEKVANFIQTMPKNRIWLEFIPGGGAIRTISTTATSFIHRKFLYLMTIFDIGNDNVEDGKIWTNKFINITKFMDNGESFQNYVDGDLLDYLKRYYGNNLHRLLCIKRKWDPKNYFQNPQSIPVISKYLDENKLTCQSI